jgi:ADP-heptose:LPS heptosyltransferase
MTICILRDDHLGDTVLTLPLVRALLQDGHDVCVLAPAAWRDVVALQPGATFAEFPGDVPSLVQPLAAARRLRQTGADAVYVPQGTTRLRLARALPLIPSPVCTSGGVAGRLLGYRCLRARLPARPRSIADVWLDFARLLGIDVAGPGLLCSLPEARLAEARLRIETEFQTPLASLVVVHPFHGGSTCHPALTWYVDVVKALRQQNVPVLLTGLAPEGQRLYRDWGAALPADVLNGCGRFSLHELLGVLAGCRAVLSGSTGVLHLASVLNTRTLGVYCPAPEVNDSIWAPVGRPAGILRGDKTRCARLAGRSLATCAPAVGLSTTAVVNQLLTPPPSTRI